MRLCHYTALRDGKVVVYNGHSAATEKGCSASAIDRMGPGFATRAVLIDLPLLKNVAWLDPHTPIYPADLEAWEKFASVKIGSGDAVLVRTGRWALREAKGPLLPLAFRHRARRCGRRDRRARASGRRGDRNREAGCRDRSAALIGTAAIIVSSRAALAAQGRPRL